MGIGRILSVALLAVSCGVAETGELLWPPGVEPDGGPPPKEDGGRRDGGTRPDGGDGLPEAGVPDMGVGECYLGDTRACTCPSGMGGYQTCRVDLTWTACWCDQGSEEDRFDFLVRSIVGNWEGTVTTPWTAPYRVRVTFREDGTYSAHSLDANNTAFYYGTDEDSALKRYRISDLDLSGDGLGEIDIYFGLGSTTRGELRRIRIPREGNRLDFEYWHLVNGRYGPVTFNLTRVP